MSRRLLECSFLVPLRRDANLSDGQLHSTAVWGWLRDQLYEMFGGGPTIAPGRYVGFYQDPDTKARVADSSRRYVIAVAEDELERLRDLLRQACWVFQQKCIYLSIAGVVEFIEAENGDQD